MKIEKYYFMDELGDSIYLTVVGSLVFYYRYSIPPKKTEPRKRASYRFFRELREKYHLVEYRESTKFGVWLAGNENWWDYYGNGALEFIKKQLNSQKFDDKMESLLTTGEE